MTSKYETLVHEVSIDQVMSVYMRDLKLVPKPGVSEINRRWYFDPTQGKVVVVISVEHESGL